MFLDACSPICISSNRSRHRSRTQGSQSRSPYGRSRSGGSHRDQSQRLVLDGLLLMDLMQTVLSLLQLLRCRKQRLFLNSSVYLMDGSIIKTMTNSICGYHLWYLSSSLYKTRIQNYYFLLYYINIKLSANIDIKIGNLKVFHLVYIKRTFVGFTTIP